MEGYIMLKQGMPVMEQRSLTALATGAQPPIELLSLGEITPDLVAALDVQGHIFYLNTAGRRMLRIGADENIADLCLADIHPLWASLLVLGDGIETAVLDGVWRGETALLTRDGREIPVSQVIVAHSRPDGECAFLLTIARDISEIKQAENALSESEQFYRRIVETANVGIWVISPTNDVTFANPKMAQLLGYRLEEMLGQPLGKFMDAGRETHTPSACDEAPHRSGGAKATRDFQLRRRDGGVAWVNLSTSPLFDREERYTGVLGMVTDITERRPVESY
jgi:PAS domain S-box-containing protein